MIANRFMVSALGLALLCATGVAQAATFSAGYPPPGGVTFTKTGSTISVGGRRANYTNFDLSQTGVLYFGLSMNLGMDGNSPALTYDSALSNLSSGEAVFTGTTNVDGSQVFTRFVEDFTDDSNAALALTTSGVPGFAALSGGDVPVLLVTGNYHVQGAFLASSNPNSGFTAAGPFYDNYPFKPAGERKLNSGTSGTFYWTAPNAGVPEPAAWGLMILGFAGVGAAIRANRTLAAAA